MCLTYLFVLAAVFGGAVVWLVLPNLCRLCTNRGWLNRTGELHQDTHRQVPRAGGIGLCLAALLGLVLAFLPDRLTPGGWSGQPLLLLPCLFIFALGFADDVRPILAGRKFLFQIAICFSVPVLGLTVPQFVPDRLVAHFTPLALSLCSATVTVFYLVFLVNLVNLVDGADGLAASICLVAFTAVLLPGGADPFLSIAGWAVVGALLVFLLYMNRPPARVFLGDSGAYLLGMLLGLISLSSARGNTAPRLLSLPLLALSLPIVCAVATVRRRANLAVPIFRPDKRHLHHQLQLAGWTPTQVLLLYFVASVTGALAAWPLLDLRSSITPLSLITVLAQALIIAGIFNIGGVQAFPAFDAGTKRVSKRFQRDLGQVNTPQQEGADAASCQDRLCTLAQAYGFATVRFHQVAPAAPDSSQARQLCCPVNGSGWLHLQAVPCVREHRGICLHRPGTPLRRKRSGKHACDDPCARDPGLFALFSELLAETAQRLHSGAKHPEAAPEPGSARLLEGTAKLVTGSGDSPITPTQQTSTGS